MVSFIFLCFPVTLVLSVNYPYDIIFPFHSYYNYQSVPMSNCGHCENGRPYAEWNQTPCCILAFKESRGKCCRETQSCQSYSLFSTLLIFDTLGIMECTTFQRPRSLAFCSVHCSQPGQLSHLFIHKTSCHLGPSIFWDSSFDTQVTPVLYFLQTGGLMDGLMHLV